MSETFSVFNVGEYLLLNDIDNSKVGILKNQRDTTHKKDLASQIKANKIIKKNIKVRIIDLVINIQIYIYTSNFQ